MLKRKLPRILLLLAILMFITTLALTQMAKAEGASIWTDKDDYGPEETVTVFGSGFLANTQVTITFVAPDSSVDTIYALTDGSGGFTAQYELDGQEGTYSVSATDGTNTAITTFTECWCYYFTATISPTTAITGETKSYTITITNDMSSSPGVKLGSAKIKIPSGFTIISSLSVSYPSGKPWTATIDSGYIKLNATSATYYNDDRLVRGESVSVTFSATAPGTAGTYEWTTSAWTDISYGSWFGIAFTIKAPPGQPTVIISTPSTVSITITSSPATDSGFVTVDGSAITTPQTYTWNVGDNHTIAANSPVTVVAGQSQYVYVNWSDGGAQSHTITVPSSATTYTANFQLQYYFSVSSTYDSPTGAGWYNAGSSCGGSSVTRPVSGGTGIQYETTGWTGTGSLSSGGTSGSSSTGSFTINAYSTCTWNWKTQYQHTVTSSPATGSGYVTVDGSAVTTPYTTPWWDSGSSHTIAANSPVTIVSGQSQYIYLNWSDSGAQSHSISPTAVTTYTANFQLQYYFSVSSAYDSPTGQGWYNAGSSVSSTVTTPVSGGTGIRYQTTGWTGTGSLSSGGTYGSSSTGSFTINAYSTCTWNWITQYQPSITLGGTSSGDTVSITARTLDGSSNTPSGLYTSWSDWCDDSTTLTFSATSTSGKQCRSTTARSWTVSSAFSATPIWDRIKVNSYARSDDRANVNDNVNIDATLVYEYDSSAVTDGTVSINGYSATHQGSGVWRITRTSATVTSVTYNTVAASGNTHGITVVNQNSQSTTVIWDRMDITISANSTTPSAGQTVQFTVSGKYEYDNVAITTLSFQVTRNGTNYATSTPFTDMQTSAITYQYTTSSASETTYGLSTFSTNTVTVTWSTVTVSITLTTSPAGCNVRLDGGTWYTAPHTYSGIISGSSHTIEAQDPYVVTTNQEQYIWASWSDSGANPHSVSPTSDTTYTATMTHQWYFLASSTYDSPTGTGWYNAGSSCSGSSVTRPVSGGTGIQYETTGWTGTGSLSSGGTSGSSSTGSFTINAYSSCTWNWKTQYQLTMGTNFGTTSPSVGSYWYDAGSEVTISATAPGLVYPVGQEQYVWNGWTGTGTGSYTGTANPSSVTMNDPISETASWTHQFVLTLETSGLPSAYPTKVYLGGLQVGTASDTSPYTKWFNSGDSTGTIGVDSVVSGSRYVFVKWVEDSSTSNPRAAENMNSPKTFTALYKTQYYLTVNTDPSGLSPAPTPLSNWYDNSTNVVLTAPSESYLGSIKYNFTYWDVDGTNVTGNPITVHMNQTHTATAHYTPTAPPPKIPVGGRSISLTKQTPAFDVTTYAALIALFGVALSLIKRKRK